MNDVVLRSGVNVGVKLGGQSVAVKLGSQNVPVKISSIQVAAAAGYSAEAQAVFDRMPNAMTTFEMDNWATVLDMMVVSGNYYKLDYLFAPFMQDPDNGLTSLFGTKTATAVNSPTHIPGVGYSFNGANYINTNITPSTDLVNAVNDDNYALSYCYENRSTLTRYLFGTYITGSNAHYTYQTATNIYALDLRVTEYTLPQGPYSNRTRYGVYRPDGNTIGWDINGVQSTTANVRLGSYASINKPFYIGGLNNNGSPFLLLDSTQSYFIIGGGLDLTALNSELNTLQSLFSLN
jgi:hypothetical protein